MRLRRPRSERALFLLTDFTGSRSGQHLLMTDSLQFKLNDGEATSLQPGTVTVQVINNPPVALNSSQTVGASLNGAVTLTG